MEAKAAAEAAMEVVMTVAEMTEAEIEMVMAILTDTEIGAVTITITKRTGIYMQLNKWKNEAVGKCKRSQFDFRQRQESLTALSPV
jgi:hypothetical protein